ncbi:ABC transporter substrate-binding protein [Tuberibacillus sp. Marseille-P3662]|uniref:ABC transporter substrate-binding protein n=1 Tax=Tuberibacillus sp. Marseille-P3662 TaxID=1965358 RepID=UPI001593DA29|nr:ABC transporter substrate-binding protein [Tuberibacillus sp. Marseille-P3662]
MIRKLLLVIASLGVLASCSDQGDGADSEQKRQKVSMMLDWSPNTNHTGLYVAKKKGFYKDEGLKVNIKQPGQGSSTDQLVASGEADFGIGAQEGVTQARAQDIPLVSIGAVIQHNTSAFASKKQAGITEVKDFEGQTYGGWGAPSEKATIKAVMKRHNADPSKVKFATLGKTNFFKSIGKLADFEWIYYGWDGVQAKLKGTDLNLIWLKDLHPALDYYTPVITTNEHHVNEQKDLTEKFMAATSKGYQYAIQHPDEAADILLEYAPELNKKLVHASQKWLSDHYQADAKKWGLQDEEVWTRYTDFMKKYNLIKKDVDIDKAFTNEFLPGVD